MRLAVRAFFVRAGESYLPKGAHPTPEEAAQDALDAKGEPSDPVAVAALDARPTESGDVLAELEGEVAKAAAGDPAQ